MIKIPKFKNITKTASFCVAIIILVIVLSGCNKDRAVIFFSPESISPINLSTEQREINFSAGERINFILINPKPFKSNTLRLQILKIERQPADQRYSILQTRDIQADINKNYVTNYFYLYLKGYYMLRIFDKVELKKPLAEGEFYIE